LARTAVTEGWSVRQVELAVRAESSGGDDGTRDAADDNGESGNGSGSLDGAGLTPATRLRPPGLLELENLLAEHLETRVTVQMGARRGRVTVEFADLEDLERLYRRMAG
jgi:ParB family chromosome partitioning protein